MWSSIEAVGALTLLGAATVRITVTWIALRGTKPRERAEIIRALNEGGARAGLRRSRRAVDTAEGE